MATLKKSQRSLKAWSKQKWRTKSGKPSKQTGERYLPTAAIKSLSSQNMQQRQKQKEKAKRQVNSLLNNLKVLLKKLQDLENLVDR